MDVPSGRRGPARRHILGIGVAGIFVATAGLFTTTLLIGGVYLAVTLCPLLSATWREVG